LAASGRTEERQEGPVGDMQIKRRERLLGAKRLRDLQVANIHFVRCSPCPSRRSGVARPWRRRLFAGPQARATIICQEPTHSGGAVTRAQGLTCSNWNDPIKATLAFRSGVVKVAGC